MLVHCENKINKLSYVYGVTAGGTGGRGVECPLKLFTGKLLLTYREKRGKGKKGKIEKKCKKIF